MMKQIKNKIMIKNKHLKNVINLIYNDKHWFYKYNIKKRYYLKNSFKSIYSFLIEFYYD